jgi:hypothetical protein
LAAAAVGCGKQQISPTCSFSTRTATIIDPGRTPVSFAIGLSAPNFVDLTPRPHANPIFIHFDARQAA